MRERKGGQRGSFKGLVSGMGVYECLLAAITI